MDFSIPNEIAREVRRFEAFFAERLAPSLPLWTRQEALPREFFRELGAGGFYGFGFAAGRLVPRPALGEALIAEAFARRSPGAVVAALAHADLGLASLALFGSPALQARFGEAAAAGRAVICLGNTEPHAGSDAAAVRTRAEAAPGGFRLTGVKAYVTNGRAADLAVVTAVTDPDAPRSRRISMFLAELSGGGVKRTPLDKGVWLPADLTRIELHGHFVPADRLIGERGRGLSQVLAVFSRSRIPMAALALGTGQGAFEIGVRQALRRRAFGRPVAAFQAKAFEIAELDAALEAARLAVWKACWELDRGGEGFRGASAAAKLLAVEAGRRAALWAADVCGAAAVMRGHPVHRFPLDAWAASLGEGTQDIQKLIISRELLKRFGEASGPEDDLPEMPSGLEPAVGGDPLG
jgi:alkylation response protein AidB-like acyl-CoA dehydrogenase